MRRKILVAALMLTVAATAAAVTGCGSSGTISSLTDSDSTASIVGGAAAETSSVNSGSLSQAESAASSAVAEILPQTIAATEISATPDAPASSGESAGASSEISEPVRVSLPGDGSDDEVVTPAGEDTESETTHSLAASTEDGAEVSITGEVTPAPEEEEFEPAGEGNTGYVTGDEVNVRAEPDASDDDNVMFTLFEGDEVKILANEDGWYKIEVDGEVGWIKSGYVE